MALGSGLRGKCFVLEDSPCAEEAGPRGAVQGWEHQGAGDQAAGL